MSDLKNRANKNVRLDDNQTSVVSNSRISGRNEIAGANPLQSCSWLDRFLWAQTHGFFLCCFFITLTNALKQRHFLRLITIEAH